MENNQTKIIEKIEIINNKKRKKKQEEIANFILNKFDNLFIYSDLTDSSGDKIFDIHKEIRGFWKKLGGYSTPEIFSIYFDGLEKIIIYIYNEDYLEELKKVLENIDSIKEKKIVIE